MLGGKTHRGFIADSYPLCVYMQNGRKVILSSHKERSVLVRRAFLLLTAMALAVVVASGVALAATINGTNHADRLVGNAKRDTIKGFGGGDYISGMGRHDTLYGGAGDDTIRGGKGDDTTDGQAGGDTLVGGSGHDRIIAGTGNNHHVFARDGQQDLICVDPHSTGTIETQDPQDRFIFNRSC